MKNTGILAVIAVVALGALGATAPASAQNTANNQLLGAAVMNKVNAADVTSMLGDFTIPSVLAEYDGSGMATVVASIEGANFFVTLLMCDDPATGVGCQRALVYTGFPNAGLTYEDINGFNGASDATTAVNMAEDNVVLFAAPVFIQGGIGRENFKLHVAYFINDVSNFASAQSGAATSVSFFDSPKADGKLDNLSRNTPASSAPDNVSFRPASLKQHAVSSAIANSWKSDFMTDEIKKALN